MNLEELRTEIDRVDMLIVEQLNRRAELARGVGEIKRSQNLSFYAPEREEELLDRLVALSKKSGGPLGGGAIRAIYREIISAALALEKRLTIAYLGPDATWTHQAARSRFGSGPQYSPQPAIRDVFMEVERGRSDYGVVPIENSTEGAVSHTLDVFADSELRICAEELLPIEHCLAGKDSGASGDLGRIVRVYSHPQAFGQCREWLRQNLHQAELIETSSTTTAAARAAEDPQGVAICSKMAAEIHRLDIVAQSIQDHTGNTTRFLVIGDQVCPPTGQDKTSVMFSLQDKAGALYSALEPFNRLHLSLSKIESRPSKRRAWEYFFFVDVLGHCEDEAVRTAIDGLSSHCTFVKVLGSYARSRA